MKKIFLFYIMVSLNKNSITKMWKIKKISKILEKYGTRINYSVFECMFTDRQFQKIQINLERWINRRYDTVVYYPMCINCYTRIIYQPIRKKIIKTVEIV